MKNLLLALFPMLFLPSIGVSQNYLWAEKIGGPNFDVVSDIDIDSANNSVMVGQFFSSITFNATTITSNGGSDGFVAKIDQDGNPLWITQIGGASSDQVTGVKVDRSTGDIYVTGTYYAAFTVAGTTLPYTSFGADAFLIKISSAGTIVWGKGFSGASSDNSVDVAIDETNGFVYAMGIGSESLSIDTATLTVASGQFIYVAKYSTSGTFQWARQYDTQASIASGFGSKRGGICMTATNDIAITGNYRGTINFDSVTLTASGSPFDYDGYVAKIDASGSVLWAESFGSTSVDYSNGIAVDASDNIWLTGMIGISAAFGIISLSGGGNNNVYIAKYNSGGTATYAFKTITGTSNESNGIDIDNNGFIYITGNFFNPITFGPFTLNNGNLGTKYFIVKFNSNTSSFEWAISPDYNQAFSPSTEGNSIVVGDEGDLFVTGVFSGTLQFNNTTLVTAGSNDVYVTRLGDCSNLNAQISATGSTNVCAGSSVLLEADTASNFNYQWLFNGAPIAGEINSNFTATAGGSYAVAIDSLGCLDTSNAIAITVSPLPNVTHANFSPVCQNDPAFTLQGGSPAGGVYSGSAVVSNTTFDPYIANLGTNLITYTYTDGNSCSDSITKTIVVNQTPAIFINSISACENGAPISLAGPGYGFPQGGMHSGPGVVGSFFNPSLAGVGTHVIYYSTAAGCQANDSIIAVVTPAPTVSISPIPTQCISNLFLPLAAYGSPFGGTFTGPGVSSNFFYPAVAGAGTHQIVYSYTSSGCTDFDTFQLVVDPIPNVVISGFPDLCEGSDAISLVDFATPQGGVFSGVGMSNDSIFDPSLSGIGNFTIQYGYSNSCGSDSASAVLNVNENPTLSLTSTDVSCNGLNDGAALASAASGLAPYNYAWSNAAIGAAVTGLSAGNYSVTVSDANGCSDSSTFSIAQPSALLASLTSTNVACNSGNDGSASVVVSGGVPAYSFLWSNGQTSPTISGLSSGSYSVTVTDANGCSTVESVTITQPAIYSTNLVVNNVTCFGNSNGSASINVSGGTPGYTHLWSNGSSGASISGLIVGNYTVTTTDANGCSIVDAFTISEPSAALTAVFNASSNVSCFGANDGSLSVTGSGGTPPYAFIWSNGSTSSSLSGLTGGSYSVTVSDANGCSVALSSTITEPALLSASLSSTNVTCNTANDGTASAVISGGSPAYSYLWSDGQTTPTAIGLSAGSYAVTITDINGCSTIESIVITEPTQFVTSPVSSDVNCFGGNDGSAAISASGGTPSYSYLWSTGSTNASVSGLSAGNYSVTTSDANGCSIVDAFTIAEPASALILSITSSSNVSCFGGNDASAVASASGGTAPYSFIWNNGSTTNSISGLSAGNYSVTLSDANGCQETQSITISEPASAVSASIVSSTNAICVGSNNGDATATASGGTPGYSYSWSNGSTTSSINGLVIDTYELTVTDASGCVDTTSVDIIPAATAAVASISSFSNATCLSANDGSAQVSVVGGTAPYTYAWSNGANTAGISSLSIGSYSVTVNSSNGCTDTASISIINSDTIAPVVAVINDTVALSALGTASITLDSVRLQSTDNCGIQSEVLDITSFSCAEIGPNTVTLIVTDNSGNTTVETATVVVVDTTSPTILVSNTTLYLDASGTAVLNSSMIDQGTFDNCGIASYSISQTNFDCDSAGQILPVTVTVIDVNGNMSNDVVNVTVLDTISPAVSAQNITAYLDASGVVNITSAMIDNGSTDACGIASLTLDYSTFTCANIGTNLVNLIATDVNGNTSFAQALVTIADTFAPVIQTTDTSIYLGANGTFTIDTTFINVSSSDNCGIDTMYLSRYTFNCSDIGVPQQVMFYAIDVNGNIDSSINIVSVFDTISPNVVANNVQLYLDVTGLASIAPASVDGGSSDSCGIDSLYLSQSDFQCNDTGTNVVTLFAIDVNGNIGQTDFTVSVFDTIAPSIIVNNLTAYLDAAGNTFVSVDSSNAGTFDNCSVDSIWLSQDSFNCSHIGVNTVTFNAMDVSGNQSSIQMNVTVLDTFAPTVYPFQLISLGLDANGSASLSVAQADSATADCDLDSLWLSQTDFTCAEIGLNTVTLLASDSSGNIASATFSVVVFDSISQIEIVQDAEILCHGDSSGVISALPSGMAGQYEFIWNTGDTTAQLSNLGAGSYFVTATSAAGCSVSDSISISEPEPYATLLTASVDSLCAGDSSAFISVMVEGNNAPYSFQWSNGSTNDSLTGIGAGIYVVSISDVNGCETFDSISIALLDCDTIITPGIAEFFSMNELSIFPNPASNVLNVNFGNWTIEEDVKMTLMNSTGQFVKAFDRDQWTQVNPNEVQLNLDEVATGIYLLNIQMNGNVATKRFIVGR